MTKERALTLLADLVGLDSLGFIVTRMDDPVTRGDATRVVVVRPR